MGSAGVKSENKSQRSAPNGGSHVTIEHHVQNSKGGGSSTARSALLFGMKPAVALVGMYAVVATAAWGFLLPWGLGLQAEVDRLEQQVNRLSSEIDDLEKNVDEYARQNDILEKNNEEYDNQNKIFTSSNEVYEGQNDRLNMSVAELRHQNQILEESNAEYARLNAELEDENQELKEEVDELGVIAENLTATVEEYTELTRNLTAEVDRLETANGELEGKVADLGEEVNALGDENDRLEKLVKDLEEIERFLEEEAGNVQGSVEELASFLAVQIDDNQAITLNTMANTFRQKTTSWTCGYDLTFRGFPFTSDPNSPIGAAYYPLAVAGDAAADGDDGYLEETVLTELCVDVDDFESYLASFAGSQFLPPVDVTTNELQSGVSRYVSLATEWYFPGVNATAGVSADDWADAGYKCENLPRERRYFWGPRS